MPGLRPDDSPNNSGPNSVSKAWFTASLTSPLLFHALAFAGLIHMDFMRGSRIYPISRQALSHKLFVIQKLKEIIKDRNEVSRDENILAIWILATHETIKPTQEKRNLFNSPLKRTKWLTVFGNTECVPEHKNVIIYLVNMKGGLEALKLPGVAEGVVS